MFTGGFIIAAIIILIVASKSGIKRVNSSKEVLGGVCGGIANKLEVSHNLVRVIAVLILLGSAGGIVLLYLLLCLVLPRE
ncbi:MAG: PspC domain-containing protein [Candidatus Obscuribacter sp.]|nr:PspC domain-containing protein [Candidatus Obscuribacter sp.]